MYSSKLSSIRNDRVNDTFWFQVHELCSLVPNVTISSWSMLSARSSVAITINKFVCGIPIRINVGMSCPSMHRSRHCRSMLVNQRKWPESLATRVLFQNGNNYWHVLKMIHWHWSISDRIECFKRSRMDRLCHFIDDPDPSSFRSDENFKVSTDTVKAVLSPDGRYACAGSQDGSIIVWNLETEQCELVLKRKHR